MSIALKYLPKYTLEDYKRWEGDWELIEGLPYAMSPSPSKNHQRINGKLYRLFSEALDHCSHCEIFFELDWTVANDTVVRPDLQIICEKENASDSNDSPPVLVIEILSPSTTLKDRNLKYELFQKEKDKVLLNSRFSQ